MNPSLGLFGAVPGAEGLDRNTPKRGFGRIPTLLLHQKYHSVLNEDFGGGEGRALARTVHAFAGGDVEARAVVGTNQPAPWIEQELIRGESEVAALVRAGIAVSAQLATGHQQEQVAGAIGPFDTHFPAGSRPEFIQGAQWLHLLSPCGGPISVPTVPFPK